jgi:hypothetical protein
MAYHFLSNSACIPADPFLIKVYASVKSL